MLRKVLLDSSYVYVLYDPDSDKYQRAVSVLEASSIDPILPDVVLTEAAFLFMRAGGIGAVGHFLESVENAQVRLEPVTKPTLRRAREIMIAYPESRLDFVDCCIMALAEQLGITQVCTFDRRDFSIFRPQHCDYLELLP